LDEKSVEGDKKKKSSNFGLNVEGALSVEDL
jgi:hypothetical protein